VLTVSKERHDNVYNPTKKNFLEYYAKNMGARRARGEFVFGKYTFLGVNNHFFP